MTHSPLVVGYLLIPLLTVGLAQGLEPRLALPLEPISAILDTFKEYEVVTLNDAHGNEQNHAFRLALIRDRRFADVVNDIVIEVGNARFQAIADRYVQGEEVPIELLRNVWRDTTVPTAANNYGMIEELFRTVREINTKRTRDRQLRILLGDPPIDWQRVRNPDEHRAWIALTRNHVQVHWNRNRDEQDRFGFQAHWIGALTLVWGDRRHRASHFAAGITFVVLAAMVIIATFYFLLFSF